MTLVIEPVALHAGTSVLSASPLPPKLSRPRHTPYTLRNQPCPELMWGKAHSSEEMLQTIRSEDVRAVDFGISPSIFHNSINYSFSLSETMTLGAPSGKGDICLL